MTRATFYLAFGSATASMVSIAACQILLGAALAALLVQRQRLRLPPIVLPLVVFVILTLIALALSADPGAGLPQLRKFYVFLMLPVVYTAIRRLADIRRMVWCWAAAGTASGLWGFMQFWQTRQQAVSRGEDVYLAYVGDRATGFMGHWMTFGAAQMAALLLLMSLLMFAPPRRNTRLNKALLIAAGVIISASIVIGWTRGVWLAAAVGCGYLVTLWRPKLLLFVPVIVLLGWFVAPRSVRERVISIYQPHGNVDSNQHRYITARAGLEMIKAHPWAGLGPEMPGKRFYEFLPADISRPLPAGFYGHLHNVYLQYAAERGIPALIAFLWLIVTLFRDWWKGVRHTTDLRRKAILHGCIAVLIAFLVEAFFEHNLGDSEVLSMFFVVIASGYRALEAEA